MMLKHVWVMGRRPLIGGKRKQKGGTVEAILAKQAEIAAIKQMPMPTSPRGNYNRRNQLRYLQNELVTLKEATYNVAPWQHPEEPPSCEGAKVTPKKK